MNTPVDSTTYLVRISLNFKNVELLGLLITASGAKIEMSYLAPAPAQLIAAGSFSAKTVMA